MFRRLLGGQRGQRFNNFDDLAQAMRTADHAEKLTIARNHTDLIANLDQAIIIKDLLAHNEQKTRFLMLPNIKAHIQNGGQLAIILEQHLPEYEDDAELTEDNRYRFQLAKDKFHLIEHDQDLIAVWAQLDDVERDKVLDSANLFAQLDTLITSAHQLLELLGATPSNDQKLKLAKQFSNVIQHHREVDALLEPGRLPPGMERLNILNDVSEQLILPSHIGIILGRLTEDEVITLIENKDTTYTFINKVNTSAQTSLERNKNVSDFLNMLDVNFDRWAMPAHKDALSNFIIDLIQHATLDRPSVRISMNQQGQQDRVEQHAPRILRLLRLAPEHTVMQLLGQHSVFVDKFIQSKDDLIMLAPVIPENMQRAFLTARVQLLDSPNDVFKLYDSFHPNNRATNDTKIEWIREKLPELADHFTRLEVGSYKSP